MPSTFNISVNQGDAYNSTIIASGNSGPLNLDGFVGQGKINVKAGGANRLYTITGLDFGEDPSLGRVTVSIPTSATSLFPVGIFPYDIDVTDGTTTLTAIKGKISVSPGIVMEDNSSRALIAGYTVNRILVSDSEGNPEASSITTTQLTSLISNSDLLLLRNKLITREIPSGAPNGELSQFYLNYTPFNDSECVFLNGLLQDNGFDNDYYISGNSVVFNEPPLENDKVRINYLRS